MTKIPRFSFLLLGFSTLILFSLKLGYLPLIFEEPRRALVSLEMIFSGNYIVPRINGFEYYNKPPFYNWILAVFFHLFGTHEWVVRLPTYLSLFAIAGINYKFFKSRIGEQSALLSSFFFLLSGHVLFYFSFIGEIDITYSLIVFGQAIVFIYFHDKEKLWSMFGWSYALMTIGFMTKGLPSIAFQGLTIIGFAVYFRKWRYLFHPANFLFLGLSLLSLFGYFKVYANYSDPFPYLAQLINESSKRTSSAFAEILINPFKVTIEFLKITFPWCFLAIPLLLRRNRRVESNKWITFGVVFLFANVWLYLLSPGTRDRYLYVFLPFIYNTLAYYLVPILDSHRRSIKRGAVGFAILLSILFAYLSIDLQAAYWLPVVGGLGFVLVVVLVLTNKLSPILSLFILMLLARVSYDLIVFPSRKQDLQTSSGKTIAPNIIRESGKEQLYFYTALSSKENALPIHGPSIITTIERLPYDLSFYLGRDTSKPIIATDELITGQWYISRKGKDDIPHRVAIEFKLEKKEWVLFKK